MAAVTTDDVALGAAAMISTLFAGFAVVAFLVRSVSRLFDSARGRT